MGMLRKDAHILRNLVTFETASRSANFTRAAEELGITRVAVSRQIAELEANLGRNLFKREHRNVSLTTAGEALANVVNPALNAISEALARQRREREDARLSVTVTSAFATYWLMPRLVDFGARHPEVEVNLVVSDRYLDLASEDIDIAVRYMPERLVEKGWQPLMREAIFPVYSPKYKARSAMACPADLLKEKLLHLSGRYRAEARWAHWFHAHNLAAPEERTGVQVNTYINMLQAAIEGQGIALAGYPLVNTYLETGALLAIESIVPLEREYYFVLNRIPEHPEARAFEAWLFSQV